MIDYIKNSFILLLPLIFSGIVHMIFVKKDYCAFLKIPFSIKLFGANKTIRGLVVMVLFTIVGVHLTDILLRSVWQIDFYKEANLSILGGLLGLFYILFELPNSFMKRRLGISPGKQATHNAFWFSLYDQMDSGAGLALVYYFYLNIDIGLNLFMIFLGTFVHLFFNVLLYSLRLRSQPF